MKRKREGWSRVGERERERGRVGEKMQCSCSTVLSCVMCRHFQDFFFSHFTLIDAHLEQLKEGVEDACHNRGAFTAMVVKVTGTRDTVGKQRIGAYLNGCPSVPELLLIRYMYMCIMLPHLCVRIPLLISPSLLLSSSLSQTGLSNISG